MSIWKRLNFLTSRTRSLTLALSFTLVILFAFNKQLDNTVSQVQFKNACMAIESNLPMNHANHPCQVTYMSNKSWLSWASTNNESLHLHFLNLTELMYRSFN